ncbi:MAG: hypothetical protein HY976_02810 [Candidatus Kerfeldbacteria bacterium]|nr:hypothetical protein [Candidatus Kerfeldbacteria bacterium]
MKFRPSRDVIIIGAAAVLIVGWWGMSTLRRGSMSITLETPTVKPGGVLTLRQDYRHEWSSWVQPQFLSVRDARGTDIAVSGSEQLFERFQVEVPAATEPSNSPVRESFNRRIREIVEGQAGIMESSLYANMVERSGFFIETIGCPVGLGLPAGAKPSAATTERQSFRVFPGTPAGEYRIVVPAKYYCGAGPTGEFTFRVE